LFPALIGLPGPLKIALTPAMIATFATLPTSHFGLGLVTTGTAGLQGRAG
jgi:hypothetical protein